MDWLGPVIFGAVVAGVFLDYLALRPAVAPALLERRTALRQRRRKELRRTFSPGELLYGAVAAALLLALGLLG